MLNKCATAWTDLTTGISQEDDVSSMDRDDELPYLRNWRQNPHCYCLLTSPISKTHTLAKSHQFPRVINKKKLLQIHKEWIGALHTLSNFGFRFFFLLFFSVSDALIVIAWWSIINGEALQFMSVLFSSLLTEFPQYELYLLGKRFYVPEILWRKTWESLVQSINKNIAKCILCTLKT